MSLATRCAACGTVFRVVQDQLKVSEGWVRCGRCSEVFNALEGLFDLEREAAPAWTPSQRGALPLLPASADEHAAQSAAAAAQGAGDGGDRDAADTTASIQDTQIDTRVDSRIDTSEPDHDVVVVVVGADADADDADAEAAVGRGEGSEFSDSAQGDDAPAAAAVELPPAFLRRAERDARWQRPQVRLALALTAGALGLLLIAHAALLHRDAIAAHWPHAAPLLAGLCAPLGCRVEPLRRLDSLAVENSGLTQLDNAALYRLQVSLRNRDRLPLLAPALDLTLTDSRGDVVARKVLSGRDFGADTPVQVAPGSELALQAVLDAGERRVTGYSIEIFYP